MPAGLVNQLMACHWIEQGHELASDEQATPTLNIAEVIKKIRSRPKPQFDF